MKLVDKWHVSSEKAANLIQKFSNEFTINDSCYNDEQDSTIVRTDEGIEIITYDNESATNKIMQEHGINLNEVLQPKYKSTQELGKETFEELNNTQNMDDIEQTMEQQERTIRDSKDNTQSL